MSILGDRGVVGRLLQELVPSRLQLFQAVVHDRRESCHEGSISCQGPAVRLVVLEHLLVVLLLPRMCLRKHVAFIWLFLLALTPNQNMTPPQAVEPKCANQNTNVGFENQKETL